MTTCIYCGARYLKEPVFGGGCPGCGREIDYLPAGFVTNPYGFDWLSNIFGLGLNPFVNAAYGQQMALQTRPKCPCCGR